MKCLAASTGACRYSVWVEGAALGNIAGNGEWENSKRWRNLSCAFKNLFPLLYFLGCLMIVCPLVKLHEELSQFLSSAVRQLFWIACCAVLVLSWPGPGTSGQTKKKLVLNLSYKAESYTGVLYWILCLVVLEGAINTIKHDQLAELSP